MAIFEEELESLRAIYPTEDGVMEVTNVDTGVTVSFSLDKLCGVPDAPTLRIVLPPAYPSETATITVSPHRWSADLQQALRETAAGMAGEAVIFTLVSEASAFVEMRAGDKQAEVQSNSTTVDHQQQPETHQSTSSVSSSASAYTPVEQCSTEEAAPPKEQQPERIRTPPKDARPRTPPTSKETRRNRTPPQGGASTTSSSSSSSSSSKPRARKDLPKFIMLIGMPGSGKSTFAKAIMTAELPASQSWHHICQDDIGSRDMCESALGSAAKDSGAHVILDRCNVEANDRKYWLDVAFKPTSTMAIFFDFPKEQCKQHVASRKDHPTIPEGRGAPIVESFAKKIQAPTTKEGFKEVHTVQSFEDIRALARDRFGVEMPEVDGPLMLHKFPRTTHLLDAGGSGVGRDDLLMDGTDIAAFIGPKAPRIVVEEKVDGANLGISLTKDWEVRCQNRSHFVNSDFATQFKGLDNWVQTHAGELCQILEPGKHVLYGEWCYAKHSLHYTHLPDYFVAFDIYDIQEKKFFSTVQRNALLSTTSIAIVPQIAYQQFNDKTELMKLLDTKSQYYDGHVEGVYLRIEDDNWGLNRAKIVRPDFIQGITDHWIHQTLVKNVVRAFG